MEGSDSPGLAGEAWNGEVQYGVLSSGAIGQGRIGKARQVTGGKIKAGCGAEWQVRYGEFGICRPDAATIGMAGGARMGVDWDGESRAVQQVLDRHGSKGAAVERPPFSFER